MPTMGEVLRDARYRLGLSIEQAEEDTKVRKKYLVALEDDDYANLPAAIYAQGFLQIYAEYLGIDPGFAGKLFVSPERSAPVAPIRPAASGLRSGGPISGRTVLGVLFTGLMVAAIFYLYSQYLAFASVPVSTMASPTDLPTAMLSTPAIVVVPTAVPVPTATPAPPTPSPTPVLGVEVEVRVTERSWVRVIGDGKSPPLFEGELNAGDTRAWKAKDRIDMRVGNAGGVEATVNGMRQGILGASGEVKNVTWGRQ